MLSFDGRVAVVTGSGRGLGASHAKFLASRGAAVVINDLGGSAQGTGASSAPAEDVVAEIIAAGGRAVANFDSVTENPEGIVRAAIDAFGRLDILVNNAGINKVQSFGPDVLASIRQHMEVHFFGTAGVTAAAWPHLIESGSGRVVNTTSPTLIGFPQQTPYVSAKGAIFAFTRTLAFEAQEVGIKVNAIAPTAATRMSDEADLPEEFKQFMRDNLPTSLVSPVVAYLAHQECAVNGEVLQAQGGEVQRLVLGFNEGFTSRDLTPELVQQHIGQILDPATHVPFKTIDEQDLSAVGK
ncbi:NAD(P)-dependent dehydrogenase (short-subunit alcohol dehydrogenase family) [Nocardia kruczakiae]|uniref:NAD(P)-dependent dehydrogenase (Short-subunit alcohol dehydrogenase family) n=1 Tax=Nocardia kruczakiae TaxID=261477 RepID=A0ABU1X914_9NOCA|nr:SDR family NAD(P)-dependent oxidoreductase [Nocardia kruczakiae]MDR7166959.1 NAD(P)-dependent dehydrogenase (short-subunit alcohol dehydrogenase family) [Nocardia kruczakiae]